MGYTSSIFFVSFIQQGNDFLVRPLKIPHKGCEEFSIQFQVVIGPGESLTGIQAGNIPKNGRLDHGFGFSRGRGGRRNSSAVCFFINPSGKRGKEFFRINGFGQIVIHSCVQTFFPIAFQRMSGHGDNRQTIKSGIGADMLCCFKAIHLRHLDIHEHRVRNVFCKNPDRFPAVACDHCDDTRTVQPLQCNLLVDLIILHQQHPYSLQMSLDGQNLFLLFL